MEEVKTKHSVPQFTAAGPVSGLTVGHVINIALAFLVWAVLWREEILARFIPGDAPPVRVSRSEKTEPNGEIQNEKDGQKG